MEEHSRDCIRVTGIRLHTVQTRRRTGAISSHIVLELDTDAGITGECASVGPVAQ